jgi:hypothetical protein
VPTSNGPGASSNTTKQSSRGILGFGSSPPKEDIRLLKEELAALRDDLARLTAATQNDDASKVHREALHAALIKMDRRINGPAQ